MSNMGYCRFRNTLGDLRDCEDEFHSEELSPEEARARAQLVNLMATILRDIGCDVSDQSEDAAWIFDK